MAGTLVIDTLKSSTTNPPAVQNTNGTEIGQFCRAWVNFNGITTATIRASFNVSSVTRNGTGDYTVNFTTAMPDANYSFTGCSNRIDNAVGPVTVSRRYGNGSDYSSYITTSSFRINLNNSANSPVDSDFVGVSVFR